MIRILINLGRVFPKGFKKKFKQELIYAGIKEDVDKYLGKSLLISLLFSLLGVLNIMLYISPIFVLIAFLFYPYYKSEERAKKVESYLPDFLNLMAANVRSGMTPTIAMLNAAKEEFGTLSEEVSDVVALSMGSESYEKIFNTLSKRIKSSILQRIVKVLITGVRTGGNLSDLLEGASEEVIRNSMLKKELITSVRSYMIFIAFIVSMGLPFLLNVSIYFVNTVQNLQSYLAPSKFLPFIPSSGIGIPFLFSLSYFIIITTSLFTSILVGSVIDHSPLQGMKYYPIFLIISIAIYELIKFFLPILITINL